MSVVAFDREEREAFAQAERIARIAWPDNDDLNIKLLGGMATANPSNPVPFDRLSRVSVALGELLIALRREAQCAYWVESMSDPTKRAGPIKERCRLTTVSMGVLLKLVARKGWRAPAPGSRLRWPAYRQ